MSARDIGREGQFGPRKRRPSDLIWCAQVRRHGGHESNPLSDTRLVADTDKRAVPDKGSSSVLFRPVGFLLDTQEPLNIGIEIT